MLKIKDSVDLKLGDKVKCKGYLVKKSMDYIYANKKHFDKENQKSGHLLDEPKLYLEDMDDEEYYQVTMECKEKDFCGIAVARKYISTKNCYTQVERDVFDPVTFGYVDTELIDSVKVEKTNYVECYLVFYALGKRRLVPVDLVEKVEK